MVSISRNLNPLKINILNTYQDGKDKTSAVYGEASYTHYD